MFEMHSKTIIGLERLMLEAAGFDFRNRHPQRLVLKLCKHLGVRKGTVGKVAYRMSLDMYRTFVPLKQTAPAMALACVELAARVCDEKMEGLEDGGEVYERWKVGRGEVMGMLAGFPVQNISTMAVDVDFFLQRHSSIFSTFIPIIAVLPP